MPAEADIDNFFESREQMIFRNESRLDLHRIHTGSSTHLDDSEESFTLIDQALFSNSADFEEDTYIGRFTEIFRKSRRNRSWLRRPNSARKRNHNFSLRPKSTLDSVSHTENGDEKCGHLQSCQTTDLVSPKKNDLVDVPEGKPKLLSEKSPPSFTGHDDSAVFLDSWDLSGYFDDNDVRRCAMRNISHRWASY